MLRERALQQPIDAHAPNLDGATTATIGLIAPHEPDIESILPTKVVQLPVMSRRDRLIVTGLTMLWLTANVVFWAWWFQPEHIVTIPRLLLATAAISYDLTLMPAIFIFFLFRMRKPKPMKPPAALRVAMVVAVVPSVEALDVLERTLAGMVANTYPHDTWVLDEGGDQRVVDLCRRYGANYWSRYGIPEFNEATWPRQAKTKSGNYNSWFQTIGYDRYDFLVQLDTDHVPVPDYLDKVLGYFRDPNVAYVALPSVYSNLEDWTSRGSSEQSQIFQGPMQMGYYGWAKTPMIIGSHAAYRMSHLREIGGFGPSRAEDHLDTLYFARAGYEGVFVPEVLAKGLGPHTLADYIVQEHQWAFSIAQVFMKYNRDWGRLQWRQRLLFLFSELWYTRFSLTYLIMFLMPLIALLTNIPIVNVPFLQFMLYSQPIIIVSLITLAWCYRQHWFKPGSHFFVSWQGIILAMARWPIVLIALINAVISIVFRGGAFTYMVTPKGNQAISTRNSLRVAAPFIVLGMAQIIVTLLYPLLAEESNYAAAGYTLFALISAIYFGVLILAVGVDHIRVNRKVGQARHLAWRGAMLVLLAGILVLGGIGAGVTVNHSHTTTALTWWPGVIQEDEPEAVNPVVPPVAETPTLAPTATPTVPAQPAVVDSWLFDPSASGVTFGAYDPAGTLEELSGLTHLYTAWSDDDTAGIPISAIEASHERGVPVMLSLEPHPIDGLAQDTIVADIITGRYDEVIRQAARQVAGLETPILIRFAHEMDMDGLYPWAGVEPSRYTAAWTRVVRLFNAEGATNALWVWSPGGTLDSPEYYPGPAWVDYVGMTILQYEGWELAAGFETPREFKELINEKYRLFETLGKPMIIAEAGISLDDDLTATAVQQMIDILPLFTDIRAVVYFNDLNPQTPISDERPDWRLDDNAITLLRESLAESDWIEPTSDGVAD